MAADESVHQVLIDEESFDTYVSLFKLMWEGTRERPLASLKKALVVQDASEDFKTYVTNFHSRLEEPFSHRQPSLSQFSGVTRLLVEAYSSADPFFGFMPFTESQPPPHEAMSRAARVVAGEEKEQEPQSPEKRRASVRKWIKVLASLSCAAWDMPVLGVGHDRMKHSLEDLQHSSDASSRYPRAIASLEEGLSAWPELLQAASIEVGEPPLGPCLFFGMCFRKLPPRQKDEIMGAYKNLKPDSDVFSCALRSSSLHLEPALLSLDEDDARGSHNVLVVAEDVRKAVPMWLSSASPGEMELLLPCLLRFKVISVTQQPVTLQSVECPDKSYTFILARVRYQGSGLDQVFVEQIQNDINAEDVEVRRMITLDKLKSALTTQGIEELRGMIQEGSQAGVGERVLKMATQRLRQLVQKVMKTAMHSGDIITLRSAIDMAIEVGLDHGGIEVAVQRLMALEQQVAKEEEKKRRKEAKQRTTTPS